MLSILDWTPARNALLTEAGAETVDEALSVDTEKPRVAWISASQYIWDYPVFTMYEEGRAAPKRPMMAMYSARVPHAAVPPPDGG